MRLEDLTTKVDTAAVDAAKLTATAEILTEEAKADPTQPKILAAYNARVAAAIEVAAAAALKKQKEDAKKDAAEAAKQAKKDKIEDELIPSFIIEEALYYYSQLEYYEVCKNIKLFFSINSKYTIQTSRAEWFGITCCK
jgi:hypothetical protein